MARRSGALMPPPRGDRTVGGRRSERPREGPSAHLARAVLDREPDDRPVVERHEAVGREAVGEERHSFPILKAGGAAACGSGMTPRSRPRPRSWTSGAVTPCGAKSWKSTTGSHTAMAPADQAITGVCNGMATSSSRSVSMRMPTWPPATATTRCSEMISATSRRWRAKASLDWTTCDVAVVNDPRDLVRIPVVDVAQRLHGGPRAPSAMP